MASPPFNIAETVPADNDFVSPFPATERTFRDVVESWFLIEGNVNGRSNKRYMEWSNPAPTGIATTTVIYADPLGYLQMKRGDTGNEMYLEVPVGTILDYGGSSTPEGYIFPAGQAVSRTGATARLFAVYSTTFGSGDGSTTFNVPDLRGRVVAGKDNMGGSAANRLTVGVSGITGTTLGATGGNENMQQHTHIATSVVTDPGHSHTYSQGVGGVNYSGGSGLSFVTGTTSTNTTGITVATTNANTGFGASQNVQPTFILNKIIKI